jgi:hypothetical protein
MNHLSSHTINTILLRNWWMLKITYSLFLIVAGADKFFNLVTEWEKYISPFVLQYFSFTPLQILYSIALFEIVLGFLTLTILTRIGAYITALWFFVVALNLLSMIIYFDIAVRDIVMAIGAIALGQLTVIKAGLAHNTDASFH